MHLGQFYFCYLNDWGRIIDPFVLKKVKYVVKAFRQKFLMAESKKLFVEMLVFTK